MDQLELKRIMYDTLGNLSHEEGIYASAKEEAFGCVFGRDTAITVLKLLKVNELNSDPHILEISRKGLLALIDLQGNKYNIESGEEPGKFIHEYRRDATHEHVLRGPKGWFWEGEAMRNFDSIDSTSLGLMAIFAFWEATKDVEFLNSVLPAVRDGLFWIMRDGDRDGDRLLEFATHPERTHGGLTIHSWTDSRESFMQADGTLPKFPIAPVEVQASAWCALRVWSNFFEDRDQEFSKSLEKRAKAMKEVFNQKFVFKDRDWNFLAQGIDGNKNQIRTITANPLLCLWASVKGESIVEEKFIKEIVERAFQEDLFDSDAGLRTMSTNSPTYNPREDSYHNGSFWPMLNGLIFEGLLNFGYISEAAYLKEASLKPIIHFQTAIELYQKNNLGYFEYRSPSGQIGCRQQAWSAASLLHMVSTSS